MKFHLFSIFLFLLLAFGQVIACIVQKSKLKNTKQIRNKADGGNINKSEAQIQNIQYFPAIFE